jgi:ankyrin repeat protein
VEQNALLDYAAKNWGIHACNDSEEDVKSQVLEFLSSSKVLLSSQVMSLPMDLTGLHLAAYFGLKSTTADLLKSGMAVDSKDSSGQTPLSWAAENGHEAVVKLLLAKDGVDLNSKHRSGQTPLSWAAENGREAVVKLLLAKDGVDPDSKDSSSRTPLSWATQNGHEAVVKLLLANNIDLNHKDKVSEP